MTSLELLAPARTTDIGIAAIDCGADAVYIAGPEFGARQAAGNSVRDIETLCRYAHRFGVRIYVTINTIILEQELPRAETLVREVTEAGADALIVQDPSLLKLCRDIPLHASTQCSIRDGAKARMLSDAGFTRLVLERQLSLNQIRDIRSTTDAELEFFVHGALCVCYSGQCYMSEHIAGRSANRGECIQACRSLYDLEDASGRTLLRNKALLSLKDLNLKERLEDLAEAGICSFKIEGRLKGASYVKNIVRSYSEALDEIVSRNPEKWRRASWGRVSGGFTPDPDKTFNRGYTDLFIDGTKRPSLSSMDAPGHLGEKIGRVVSVRPSGRFHEIKVDLGGDSTTLRSGDGFAWIGPRGEISGFRADTCQGDVIRTGGAAREGSPSLPPKGAILYRNIDSAFEKSIEASSPKRLIDVSVCLSFGNDGGVKASASSEDGRTADISFQTGGETALNPERMSQILHNQISKTSGIYRFSLREVSGSSIPLMSAAEINGIRRALSDAIDATPCLQKDASVPGHDIHSQNRQAFPASGEATYKDNVANSLSGRFYEERGIRVAEQAYELTHRKGVELMRSRYCVKAELGLCPTGKGRKSPLVKVPEATGNGPLYLLNNGRRYRLGFDCRNCEMTVSEA